MTSENAKKTVSLNDYIIDIGGAATKCSVTYEVVLENNTDFIIKRRTLKTDRELVVLVSKGIYYIKDCKNGNIEELKESSLTTFLRELKDGFIQLHQVHWLSNIYRESVGLIMQVITDEQLTDMCRHNVLVNTFNPSMYSRYWEQNSKLFTRLYNMFPSMTDLRKYQSSIPVIFWIEDQYGANEAMYFAEKLVQSGIMELNYSDSSYYYANDAFPTKDAGSFMKVMASPYRINLRRFIDYILFDLYAQGYARVDKSFFNEYLDYLSTGLAALIRNSQSTVEGDSMAETSHSDYQWRITLWDVRIGTACNVFGTWHPLLVCLSIKKSCKRAPKK